MHRARILNGFSPSRTVHCGAAGEDRAPFRSTTKVMPISPPYTSPFLESDEYKYFLHCVDEVRTQQEADRIKSTEMERVRRTARYVGFDMDSAKPKNAKAESLKDD
ncbi:hypothetical protein XU18_3429 [Perkinsela sp. CCAP 1560/4]|nr:hypothetical protein XU18_3429 [Perkinsela sp. CCAP 1560/4]|eukprot:KNH05458.1 hypothetical protein XU18_3429 [Perkinsela sp. CCAP 1560/4]